MATYAGEWKNYDDVKAEYPELPAERHIVFATYDVDGYEGSATVIYEQDGKWFENHDGHCSCNGLDTWAPEETSPEALLMQKRAGEFHLAVAERQKLIARRKVKTPS